MLVWSACLATMDSTMSEMFSMVLRAGAFDRLDDVLPPQHRERLELAGEEAGQVPAVEVVAQALQLVDLPPARAAGRASWAA